MREEMTGWDLIRWMNKGCDAQIASKVKCLVICRHFYSQVIDNIGLFTNLSSLHFDRCVNFFKIPEEVFNLTTLTYLDIHGCDLNEISPNISKLVNLKYLSLTNNKIYSYPIELCQLKLDKFRCFANYGNFIDVLHPDVAKFINLYGSSLNYSSPKNDEISPENDPPYWRKPNLNEYCKHN